jgi:hypothetical protein
MPPAPARPEAAGERPTNRRKIGLIVAAVIVVAAIVVAIVLVASRGGGNGGGGDNGGGGGNDGGGISGTVVIPGGVIVREEPGSDSDRAGSLEQGAHVEVTCQKEENGGQWLQLQEPERFRGRWIIRGRSPAVKLDQEPPACS